MARAVEESGVAAESGGERPVRRSGSSRTAHEVVLQWREIRYEVPVTYTKEDADGSKRKETASKTILHDQNGVMRPGDFLAIMGPSGSGKTSLLNILARVWEETSGELLVNGEPVSPSYHRVCGYVRQETVFFESLTVRETLQYTARLRLPASMSREDKFARVEEVLEELDLTEVADSRIGNAVTGGISGGERRRLSVAMELLYRPSVLLLDEPTSGLDSTTAMRLVRLLSGLAVANRCTIACTIHQPRASILPLFNKMLLLAGGKTVYYGPGWSGPGNEDGILAFMRSAQFPSPSFENPADFCLDLVNMADSSSLSTLLDEVRAERREAMRTIGDVEEGKATADSGEGSDGTAHAAAGSSDKGLGEAGGEDTAAEALDTRGWTRADVVDHLCSKYNASDLPNQAQNPGPLPPPLQALEGEESRQYPTSWLNQFVTLFSRSFFYKLREPIAVATQALTSVLMCFIIGSIYWQIGLDQQSVNDRIAAIALVVIMQAFMSIDIILLWPVERAVYLRDQESGMYCTSAFYLGRTLAEMPFHLLFSAMAGVETSLMFGLRMGGMLEYVIIIVVVTQVGVSLLMLVSSLSKNMEQANMLATVVLILFMVCNGFFVTKDRLPVIYHWLYDISFMRLAVEAAVVNEMKPLTFTCTEAEAKLGCVPSGQAKVEQLGFEDVTVGGAVGWLLAMMVVYRFLAYLGLRFCHTGKSIKERLKT